MGNVVINGCPALSSLPMKRPVKWYRVVYIVSTRRTRLQSQLGHTATGAICSCSSTDNRNFLILVSDFFLESKSAMLIIEDCHGSVVESF